MSDARCFLLEPATKDTRRAADHGDVIQMFDSHADHPPVFSPGFARAVAASLRDFRYDPEEDLIILTGMNVAMCVLSAVVAIDYGPFRALVWDPRIEGYEVIRVGGEVPVSS